jgi:hypothetical protein
MLWIAMDKFVYVPRFVALCIQVPHSYSLQLTKVKASLFHVLIASQAQIKSLAMVILNLT